MPLNLAALGMPAAQKSKVWDMLQPVADKFTYTGNVDLTNRPQVKNPDGSISTIRSMSFQDDTGQEVLVPTVSDDGKILSDKDAINNYYKTGKYLGKFKTPQEADIYAERLHNQQAEYYGIK